jgi:hypothetical protein
VISKDIPLNAVVLFGNFLKIPLTILFGNFLLRQFFVKNIHPPRKNHRKTKT